MAPTLSFLAVATYDRGTTEPPLAFGMPSTPMSYLFDLVAVIVFAAHLICMNIASAAPLASMWFDWRRADRPLSHATARYTSGSALVAYLVGMLLGVTLMLLAWNAEQTKAIFSLLERKIMFGVMELVFSLVLLVPHYFWLRRSTETSPRWAKLVRALFVLLATSNLLYHFPPLFAVAGMIADGWQPEASHISAALFREQLVKPEVASQSVHFALASLAAAGIVVMGFALRQLRNAEFDSTVVQRVAVLGARFALVPTLLQILVGMWVLLSLPRAAQQRLMGADLATTGLFLLSLAAALGLMHQLASVAMGDSDRKGMVRCMAAFVTTVLLMTAVLYSV